VSVSKLDVYVPAHNLAIEYQGYQHYKSIEDANQLQGLQQQRDDMKRKQCEKAKVTLVTIPYWWDGTIGSLAATLRTQRPDLPMNISPQEIGSPISHSQPNNVSNKE